MDGKDKIRHDSGDRGSLRCENSILLPLQLHPTSVYRSNLTGNSMFDLRADHLMLELPLLCILEKRTKRVISEIFLRFLSSEFF